MGSIQKRGKNSWRLITELGYDAQGNRVQEKKTIKIEDPLLLRAPKRLENHLNKELLKFQMECEAGTYMRTERLTFESFIKKYFESFVDVELEVKTRDNYYFQINKRILPYFKKMHLEQIKTMHVNDYFSYLRKPEAALNKQNKPLGSATIIYNYRILRSIFSKAVDWKALKQSPMTGVSKPKQDDVKEMEVYDEKEISALFEALEHEPMHLRVLITLAVTMGLRRGELAGLEWSHIDFNLGTLEVKQTIPKLVDGIPVLKGTKNKKTRKLALPDSVVEELRLFHREWRKDRLNIEDKWEGGKHEFLFSHLDGKPLAPQRLTKRWIAFHRDHGLKAIRLHDLRHTSASFMIFKKIHSSAIAKRLGHSGTKTLEIYSHIFESVDKAAAVAFDDVLKPRVKQRNKKA